MIKVLTDQSASDSEPAIILTESNEHSEPPLSPKHERRCHPLAVGKPQGKKKRAERGRKTRVRKRGKARRSRGKGERQSGVREMGGGRERERGKSEEKKKAKTRRRIEDGKGLTPK